MGLFKKFKDILFDDEEDFTDQIKITPEMRNEATPSKSEVKVEKVEKPKVNEIKIEENKKDSKKKEDVSNQDNFPFLDFDVEEFEKQHEPTPQVNKTVNVTTFQKPFHSFEHETKRRIERRFENKDYERIEIIETTEKKKFKPSDIISPVYGVIKKGTPTPENRWHSTDEKPDIETVRDKAFGEFTGNHPIFLKEEEQDIILPKEEDTAKVKTIDELLEETHSVDVDLEDSITEDNSIILPSDQVKEDTKEMKVKEDTTELESDIFNLIDSMYDEKEEDL